MILWTIQAEAAWKRAERRGVLRADGRRIDGAYRPAYRWMTQEMIAKIGKAPTGIRYPVWAWAQHRGIAKRRPDLRESTRLVRGTAGVLVEFEVDDEHVLLSDFDLFWWVLTGSYLPTSERDFERQKNADRRTIRRSWSRTLDLTFAPKDVAVPLAQKSLQGTLWEVRLEQVRRVQQFVAR